MIDENYVVFKGKKNGINIILNDSIDFNTLKVKLEKKVMDSIKFFENSKTAIKFVGRELSECEEEELLKIIIEKSNLNVAFVHDLPEEKKETQANQNFSYLDYLLLQQSSTKYYKGAIRNGQFLKCEGSVVVIGDVNPGAQIMATGNIIVLGSLKGLVHAGSNGNKDSFVAAINMIPYQLRIADIFTRFPEGFQKKRELNPSKAYILNDKIYIEPLINRQ